MAASTRGAEVGTVHGVLVKGVCMLRVGRRLSAATALLVSLSLVVATSSLADETPPTITLLAPANGATISTSAVTTFSWQVTWATPPAQDVTITWQLASDAGFSLNPVASSQACPASNPACFTSTTARPPAAGTWYWRVAVTTPSGTTYSQTSTFTATQAPDADRDGVEDGRDNCPTVPNPDQLDANKNGVGDACEPDRVAPRVTMESGTLERGKRATFYFHVSDDRGSVRAAFTLSFHDSVLARGSIPFTKVIGVARGYFYLKDPVPKGAPAGLYKGCVQVWDKAGNSARSCAGYRLK
jgi:hypothetical protein